MTIQKMIKVIFYGCDMSKSFFFKKVRSRIRPFHSDSI